MHVFLIKKNILSTKRLLLIMQISETLLQISLKDFFSTINLYILNIQQQSKFHTEQTFLV